MTHTPLILLLSAVALLSALPADAQCTNCGVIPGSPAEFAILGTTTNQLVGETADESFDGNWAAIGVPGFQVSGSNAGQVQLYMRMPGAFPYVYSYFATNSWAQTNTLSLSDFGISPVGKDSFGWSARIGGNDFLAVTSPGPVQQRVFFYQRSGSTWAPFPSYLDTNPNPSDTRALPLIAGLGAGSAPICSTGSGVARIAMQGPGNVAIYDIDVAGGTIYPPAIISQSGNGNGDLAFDGTDCQTLVVGGSGSSLLVFRASSSSPNPSWALTQELPAPATQNTASENTFGLSVVTVGSAQLFTRPIDMWADWLVVGYPQGDCPEEPFALPASGIVVAYFRNSTSHQYSSFQTICSSDEFENGRFGESVGISNGQILALLPGNGFFGALYSYKFYDSLWQQNVGAVTSTMDPLPSVGHPAPVAAPMTYLVVRRDSIIYASPTIAGPNGHSNAGAINIKFAGCGDGLVESFQGTPFEACDSGGVDTASCNASCTVPVCGDFYTNTAAGEQCDDGNANGTSGDACSSTCQLVQPSELNTSLSTMNAAANYDDSSVTLSAAVTNTTNSIAINEGTVTFTVNGSSVASGTVTGGTATASFPLGTSVNAGTYAIAASFGPSTHFNASSTTGSSGTLTVNQDSASITVSNASAVYGVANVTLNATVSNTTNSVAVNGGTVMFTVNGTSVTSVAVSNGAASATFTLGPGVNAGSYSITASYSGSTDFKASATVSPATLTITPATLTVIATAATKVYGQADPVLTYTANGFQFSDTAASVLTGALARAAGQAVGTYAITQGTLAANSNYNIQFTGSALTITPAPLTITANNRNKTYGQTAAFAGTEVTTNGLLNSDSVASVTLTSAGAAATATVAGSPYAIAPSAAVGPGLGNYNISYMNGALTVTPALLTITASNAAKILNAPNPALNGTSSGFVNGENASVLTANPTCSTTATTTSPVGSYPITCSGATAANYTFAYVQGTLSVLYATAIGHVIQPPINADGSSVYKQGRTVPAKFNVYDANGVPIGTPGVVSSFFLTGIVTGTTPTAVEDVVDTSNPDTSFRWDGQEWIFNVTTANLPAGSTYIYTITMNDGSTIMFQFGLR